ncbi:MAG: class II aldolase/adducin family protein [Lachnospiraceae bacterium]|nr:class II aldolase/adducin family protein [Lachnospiraceae bacterium]
MERTKIVHFFKRLYETGDITLYEGNFSARLEDHFLITPSQQSKETLTEDMLVEIDAKGNVLYDNGYVPSSEYRMHLALYSLREDVRAIVHTHSVFATAFALKSVPVTGELAELSLFFGGEIPCCSYGKPGTEAVYADFERYFVREKRDVVLLAKHGLVAAGSCAEEAFARAQTAEKIAKITLLSQLVG